MFLISMESLRHFSVTGTMMAFVYLSDSSARYSAADRKQGMNGMACFQASAQGTALLSLVSGWGVPSATVSLVARRDREDK